jgi:hypothetical protein
MMVRILLMLGHLVGIYQTHRPLRHLLADTRVDLAHLRPLTNLVPLLLQEVGCLNGSQPRRSPHGKRPQRLGRASVRNHLGPLLLAMHEQRVRHLPGVGDALLRQRRIGAVRVLFGRDTGADKVCGAGLDVEVGQVEHDAMR